MIKQEIEVIIPKECPFREDTDCKIEKKPAKECKVEEDFPDDCPLIDPRIEYLVVDDDLEG